MVGGRDVREGNHTEGKYKDTKGSNITTRW
jgi:hypothetical protein